MKRTTLVNAPSTALALIIALAMTAAIGPGSASARARTGLVKVSVEAPAGVPANASLKAGAHKYLVAKPPSGTKKASKFTVRPGSVSVAAPPVEFNGTIYEPRFKPGRRVRVAKGQKRRVSVKFQAQRIASKLSAVSIGTDSISLAWKQPAGSAVRLIRVAGPTPSASAAKGTKVGTSPGSATDTGLVAGTTYSYSIFTRPKKRGDWLGPVTATIGTASNKPGEASYQLSSSTLRLGPDASTEPARASAKGDQAELLTVQLKPGVATPLIGAAVILAPSQTLPAGFLGTVQSVDASGRSVTLKSAGIGDAFDYYKLDASLADAPILTSNERLDRGSSTSWSSTRSFGSCLELGGSEKVTLKPSLSPGGHFDVQIKKQWGIPHRADFDIEAYLDASLAADLEASTSVSCSWPGLKTLMVPIATAPVPISLAFDPDASLALTGSASVKNVGYHARGGFWVKGSVGSSNHFDGGLIKQAGPTQATVEQSAAIELSLGGTLILGPGAGNSEVGAIAGVGGSLYPLKASFGVNNDKCLETSVGMKAGLSLNAKAWAGPLSVDKEFTLDSLQYDHTYAGPWFIPTGCDKESPSDTVLGEGVEEVSSTQTGNSDQVGYEDGFVPGKNTWILSTGSAADAAVDDPSFDSSTDMGGNGDPDLSQLVNRETYDAASYEVTLVPSGDTLHVRYIFGSEEYPEWVGSQYDDVMALFVNGTNCAVVPGSNTRVSVNSINADTNSDLFVDNSTGAAGYSTSLDGLTVPLGCDIPVTPGQQVTVKIAVADSSDAVLDSAVGLLDQGIWSD